MYGLIRTAFLDRIGHLERDEEELEYSEGESSVLSPGDGGRDPIEEWRSYGEVPVSVACQYSVL